MKRVIIHHYDQNGHAMVRFRRDTEILTVYDERPEFNGMDAGNVVGMEEKGILSGVEKRFGIPCLDAISTPERLRELAKMLLK